MSNRLPDNSSIKMGLLNDRQLISLPYSKPGFGRYFYGAFMFFWLGGWAWGFLMVGSIILSGGGNAFLYFWFGGWSVGGVYVIYTLYRLFRGTKPQLLWVNKPNLNIDTGIPPINLDEMKRHPIKTLKTNRIKAELKPNQIKTLTLRETGEGNRLTIDYGADRFELASGSTEVEREWLYNYLADEYGLEK